MSEHLPDNVRHPAHYEVYPVQPIEITRHLGFCLGNAVKYVLRAPWKGGVEDCEKALQYLAWERETPQEYLGRSASAAYDALDDLVVFLADTRGDALWNDMSTVQCGFLVYLKAYLVNISTASGAQSRDGLADTVRDLSRVLSLRDTTGQIYEGMSGRPGGGAT